MHGLTPQKVWQQFFFFFIEKCALMVKLAASWMCHDTSIRLWVHEAISVYSGELVRLLPVGQTSMQLSNSEAQQNSHYKVQCSQQISVELCCTALAANWILRGGKPSAFLANVKMWRVVTSAVTDITHILYGKISSSAGWAYLSWSCSWW